MASLSSFMELDDLFGPRQRRNPLDDLLNSQTPPLDPQEADSLVQHLARGGLGALHAVGRVLDVGGPTVRNTLGSIFGVDPENADEGATSKDLYRALYRNVSGGDELDPGGWGEWFGTLGTDIATSPLTYLNPFTVLTKGGKVAQSLGLLGKPGVRGMAPVVERIAARKMATAGLGAGNRTAEELIAQQAAKLGGEPVKGIADLAEQAGAKTAAEWTALKPEIGSVGARSGGQSVGKRFAYGHTTVEDLAKEVPGGLEKVTAAAAQQGRNLDELLAEPIGALGSFMGMRLGTDWSNPLTRGIGNTLDVVGDYLARSYPGRMVAKAFDAPSLGTSTTEGQRTARGYSATAEQAVKDSNSELIPLMMKQDALVKSGAITDANELNRIIYTLNERSGAAAGLPIAPAQQRALDALGRLDPATQSAIREIASKGNEISAGILKRRAGLGMDAPTLLDDLADYAARRGTQHAGGQFTPFGGSKVLSTAYDNALSRKGLFKNVPGGTATLEEMSVDPLLRSLPEADALQRVVTEYGFDPNIFTALNAPKKAAMDAVQESMKAGKITFDEAARQLEAIAKQPSKAEQLLNYFRTELPKADKDEALYVPYLSALSRSSQGAAKSLAGGDAILGMVGRYAPGARALPETTDVLDILRASGFTKEGEVTANALKNLAKKMGDVDPVQLADDLLKGKVRISTALANDATKVMRGFLGADSEIKNVIDSVNALWRAGVTSPWIAFHVRNRYSGAIQNFINGAWDIRSEFEVDAMLKEGRPAPGMMNWPGMQQALAHYERKATDEEAFKLFQELTYRNQVIGRNVNIAAGTEALADQLGTAVPGMEKWPGAFQAVAKRFNVEQYPGKWNPLASRGSEGLNRLPFIKVPEAGGESSFWMYKAGEDLSWKVEAANRLVPIVNKLKKGWDFDAAADFAKFMHADYSRAAFAPFENEVMRRLIPFYSFQRKMLSYIVNTLAEHPGGGLAQTIRASAKMTEGNQILPDYVTQGAAIPITGGPLEYLFGPNPSGGPRVLAGLSLMHESPMSILGPLAQMAVGELGPSAALKNTGVDIMANTAPYVKGPIEFLTGKSFWQRGPHGLRDIEEQDPVIGRLLANVSGQKEAVKYPGAKMVEPLVSNLLAPRVFTTLRQATDPRKRADWARESEIPPWIPVPGAPFWGSALAGMRIADIEPRTQDAQIREAADAALMETGLGKSFERVYVPREVRAELGPLQSQVIDQLSALKIQLEKRAKQRKAGLHGEPIGTGYFLP